jgi:spore coat protein A
MEQVKQKLHRDLPPTTVWGYNGMYPGPTFEVRRKQPIFVKWENKLPFEHLLPVDRTIHGAEPDKPSVRTVVHLHEGRVRPENDGYPEAWFTRDFNKVGPKFVHDVYYYPNCQRPATLWYHDHTLGITRLNVYAGLAGFYILRDKEEEALNLPSGKFEIPLVIQDRSFYPNGELFYPTQPGHEPPPAPQNLPIDPDLPNPSIVPEFFGNTILVNGKAWPFLEVEPRKYRFRILNGSNARFYHFRLDAPGLNFTLIGNEGGLLESPILVNDITLAPAERVDVIIDFSNHEKQNIILTNDARAPFPFGDQPPEDLTQIMQFRVKSTTLKEPHCFRSHHPGKTVIVNRNVEPKLPKPDKCQIPERLSCFERLDPSKAVTIRRNVLLESEDIFHRPKLLLNNMDWDQLPITDTPYNGTIEIWDQSSGENMFCLTSLKASIKFKALLERYLSFNHKTTGSETSLQS